MRRETNRILLEASIILVLGVVIGLSVNTRLVMDAFSGKIAAPSRPAEVQPSPSAQQFPQPTVLEEVKTLVTQGAVLVDARAWEVYLDGHIAKAWALPLGEVEEHLEAFLAAVPKDRVLVVYCSGYGCPDSFDLGIRLLEEGYLDVRVFEGGYPEWRDAGLPTEKGQP